MRRRVFEVLRTSLRKFRIATGANVAMTFAIGAVPLMGAVGAGIDFAGSMKDQSAMQSALDSAALALLKNGSTLSASAVQPFAQKWFDASFKEGGTSGITITASYDATNLTATVSGSGSFQTSLLKIVGVPTINVKGSATAKMEGKKWPVCVEVTSPASNHTLIVMQTAQITFDSCMVQVNTQNWDAVEARNSAFIHSTNGDNCFVGDIHFGDILPAKDPTCTFFPDPFANYAMPASVSNCDFTNMAVTTAGTTLNPGTYCNGLTITKSATLSPGMYIIRDGDLNISGGGTVVTGNGVVFIFTGNNTPGFDISASAQVTLTPPQSGVGDFAGFVFYFDQQTAADCVPPSDGSKVAKLVSKSHTKGGGSTSCVSVIESGANVTLSGIVYLIGQQFLIQNASKLTINPGTLIADMIVGTDNATMSMTGSLSTSTAAEIAMQKQGTGVSPVLVH